MPIYTVKEFAELTGKKPKDIHTYVSRNKIIKDSNRKIDSNNPVNALFLEQYKINTTDHIEEPKQAAIKKPKKESNQEEKPAKEKAVKSNAMTKLSLEKMKLEVEDKRKSLELKDEQLRKLRGETIDLNRTITLVKTFSDSMKREYSQLTQILIQDICARHGIDSGKAGEYKLKVNDLVNKATSKSVQVLKDLQ